MEMQGCLTRHPEDSRGILMESNDLREFSRSGGTSSRYKMNDDDLGLRAADFGANHERTQTLDGDRAVKIWDCTISGAAEARTKELAAIWTGPEKSDAKPSEIGAVLENSCTIRIGPCDSVAVEADFGRIWIGSHDSGVFGADSVELRLITTRLALGLGIHVLLGSIVVIWVCTA
ncbi:hypothetical protein L484_002879 [Morus notabilis]|uniref:Uncharacterized protein n=1 Tax=Morus notabilis TaxID=981085 RepID=W9S6W3_9ROSA|nr:hypothetical protein L484_002879 [Morus notabilis]